MRLNWIRLWLRIRLKYKLNWNKLSKTINSKIRSKVSRSKKDKRCVKVIHSGFWIDAITLYDEWTDPNLIIHRQIKSHNDISNIKPHWFLYVVTSWHCYMSVGFLDSLVQFPAIHLFPWLPSSLVHLSSMWYVVVLLSIYSWFKVFLSISFVVRLYSHSTHDRHKYHRGLMILLVNIESRPCLFG